MRRTLLTLAGSSALVAVVAVGLSQTHTNNAPPHPQAPSAKQLHDALAGSPPALDALHRQANELLGADSATLRRTIASLRGFPVVLNRWGSWCGPCRSEFPLFEQVSARFGRQVGFVGLDGADNRADAGSFLARFPVSYPSYEDPSESIGRSLNLPQTYPETVFFDRRGAVNYIKQGAYADERQLVGDVNRYALGA